MVRHSMNVAKCDLKKRLNEWLTFPGVTAWQNYSPPRHKLAFWHLFWFERLAGLVRTVHGGGGLSLCPSAYECVPPHLGVY